MATYGLMNGYTAGDTMNAQQQPDSLTQAYVKRVVDAAPPLRGAQLHMAASPQDSGAMTSGRSQQSNPFGRWTKHRATIAALSRRDAHDATAEMEARSLLRAARLADRILEVNADLTPGQRATLRGLLV